MTTVQSITKNSMDYRYRRYYVRIATPTGALEIVKTSNWKPGYMPINPMGLIRSLREIHYPVGIKIEN